MKGTGKWDLAWPLRTPLHPSPLAFPDCLIPQAKRISEVTFLPPCRCAENYPTVSECLSCVCQCWCRG